MAVSGLVAKMDFRVGERRWKNFTRNNGLSNQEVLALGAGADGTDLDRLSFGVASTASI